MKSLLVLFLSATVLYAGGTRFSELKLTDGKVLKDVELLKVEPDALKMEHSEGTSLVPIQSLPAEMREHYARLGAHTGRMRQVQEKIALQEAQDQSASEAAYLKAVREPKLVALTRELQSRMSAMGFTGVGDETALRNDVIYHMQSLEKAGRADLVSVCVASLAKLSELMEVHRSRDAEKRAKSSTLAQKKAGYRRQSSGSLAAGSPKGLSSPAGLGATSAPTGRRKVRSSRS